MEYRIATDNDLDLLADWNRQLIRDEGHRNRMNLSQLRDRMKQWLTADYTAVVFSVSTEPVAYALFRTTADGIYLRQLFVRRDKRSRGLGTEAVALLKDKLWPPSKRLTVDVLCNNHPGIRFWRSLGYRDYCLTLEIMPDK